MATETNGTRSHTAIGLWSQNFVQSNQLFNINQFRAQGWTAAVSIMEFQYADNNVIVALSEEDM